MYRVVRRFGRIILSKPKIEKINKLIKAGLPVEMRPALECLVKGKGDPETELVVRNVENRRAVLAAYGNKEVPIWYSPRPGSSGSEAGLSTRPDPGSVMSFTMERIAKTGKNRRWGAFIYLLARSFNVKTVFELGACAGISGLYLASAKSVERLVTVEGSKSLAEIAKESLACAGNAKVVNALFDDAIDSELPALSSKIDMAFIDGHHEKIATIHYLDKLLPFVRGGAVVVFDDISWSQDMREAWGVICRRKEFLHAVDLGAIGVCITKNRFDSKMSEPIYWDLRSISGKRAIGKPKGWE